MGASGIEGFRRDFGGLGIPEPHLLFDISKHSFAAVGVTLGSSVEIGHGFHFEISALQFSENQLQGGSGLLKAQIIHTVSAFLAWAGGGWGGA
jgi:hypothetical protein